MSLVLEALLGAFLILVFVPVAVFLVQIVCAAIPRAALPPPNVARPRLAVLVPAHDEAAGIRATLDGLLSQLVEGDRLVVVADNCSDGTAQLAAAAGAEVTERHDVSRRGKGYALDFGVRYLAHEPPQVVVIVDADCVVSPGAIERVALESVAANRPVQAAYLIKSPAAASTMTLMAEFACLVKNLARPLGFHRLGLPCQLTGSGMAIPWPLIASADLASGHLVEDMKMGVDFARAGAPPLFCPEALVESYFPENEEGSRSQRTRWEHGHLSMIVNEVPRLLLAGLRGNGAGLLALALDMCVAPLALLGLVVGVLLVSSAAHAWITGSALFLVAACGIFLVLTAAVALAWLRFGYAVLPFGAMLLSIGYLIRKAPVYMRFLIRRQSEWVRSKRDVR